MATHILPAEDGAEHVMRRDCPCGPVTGADGAIRHQPMPRAPASADATDDLRSA